MFLKNILSLLSPSLLHTSTQTPLYTHKHTHLSLTCTQIYTLIQPSYTPIEYTHSYSHRHTPLALTHTHTHTLSIFQI